MSTLDFSTLKPVPIKHPKFKARINGKKYWFIWCLPEGYYGVYEDGAYCQLLRLTARTKTKAIRDLTEWLNN